MLYGPDMSSDDEDGLSDDNEYYEFKEKLKAVQRQAAENIDTEAEEKQRQLKTIFSAISFGRPETVFTELDTGVDVDVDLEFGWTPFLLACTTGDERIISGLLERGANVHQRKDGTTPLMLLCAINSNDETVEQSILTCVKLLLERGVDVNIVDSKRRTAIMCAANNGHLETVKLLLPLVDKNAEDNQRWDVLFWAVDGNHLKIVQFLLSQGFTFAKVDIRGNTAADLAHSNGFQDIVDLFPKDPFDEFYSRLNNNELNFEETFDVLGKNEKPQFFSDICKILRGTKSEHVMPILWDQKITLGEFLALTDTKLQELGVQFPYQRQRIVGGLYKFHKHPFKPQSIPFIKRDQMYTNIDVAASVLTCIKQLHAMEAGLKFVIANSTQKLSLPESKEMNILIAKTRQQINRLNIISQQLVKKTEQSAFFACVTHNILSIQLSVFGASPNVPL
ncbi:ankyrin repeat, SAM and basic leucine zipper domain-containing protein 1-like isoform X2 [Zophobas morio]|uniref:ankyrin repeat, SAM and basic leucine zipper domain-containing protein 1-like isoform X2 n=1 Tax=Zophobas morio TaxID=2755281 RepID=UPI0030830C30